MSLESVWWIKLVNIKRLFTEVFNTSNLFSFQTKQTKTKITQSILL